MATAAILVSTTLRDLLAGENGINLAAANLSGDGENARSGVPILVGLNNVPIDLAERSPVVYPSVYVYCEKLANSQREKFRTFSGKAQMVVEVRASADVAERTASMLHLYTQSVLEVLHANRGDWGSGVFFSGAYEVTFGPVKRGGVNYLQYARINLTLDVSVN